MKHIILNLISGAFASAYLLNTAPVASAVTTVEEIKQRILDSRTQFGQGVLHITTVVDLNVQESYEKKTIKYTIIWRDNDIRVDRNQIRVVNGRNRHFAQRRVFANGRYIYDEVDKDHVPVEIGNWKPGESRTINAQAGDEVFDPRICGLVVGPVITWDQYGIEDALNFLSEGEASVRHTGSGDDRDTIEVVWTRPVAGTTQSFLARLSPDKGYGIISAKAQSTIQSFEMDVDYRQYPNDTWFPQRIRYQESADGAITYRETSEIDADFVTPVDDRQFRLESFELRPGRRVRVSGEQMVWNGERLLSAGDWASAENRPPNRMFLFWISAASLFAFVALVFVVRVFRKRAVG